VTRHEFFFRLLTNAAWVHKGRALTALLSIGVMSAMTTVVLTVHYGVEAKLNREFRSFGGNAIATARNGILAEKDLMLAHRTAGNTAIVPVAYAVARTSTGESVVIGGADLHDLKELNSWWTIKPVGDSGAAGVEALIGSKTAKGIFQNAEPVAVMFGDKSLALKPSAVFHSGSDDDSRIYVDLAEFITFTGVRPGAAYLRIAGSPEEIEHEIERLNMAWTEVEIKPVRQIVAAQTVVLGKTKTIVLYVSAVVILLIMLCMAATQTSSVLERRTDFAVMKALGASNARLNLLFAGEAALISVAGGVLGFMVGAGLSYWIGVANFSDALVPPPVLLLPVLLGSVVTALVASIAPLRLLYQIQPANILKGE
jgi:putative ABC transport system permease protein